MAPMAPMAPGGLLSNTGVGRLSVHRFAPSSSTARSALRALQSSAPAPRTNDQLPWGSGVHSACTPRRLGLPGYAAREVGTFGAGTRAAHVSTRALPPGRLPCASGASAACSGQPAGTRTLHVLSTAVALLDLTTCQHGSRAVLRQLRQLLGRRLLSPSERVYRRLERLHLARVALPAGRRSCGRLLLLQLL